MASSLAFDVIEFNRKWVAAAKPSEIDLIPFSSFDQYYALWLSNRCADIIFEINDALARPNRHSQYGWGDNHYFVPNTYY
jgi:hypothetical protein